jgi:uncharacterized phosphosugar-binding protein
VTAPQLSAGQRYLGTVQELIDRVRTVEWDHLHEAARAIADALAVEHKLHVFGTGHSHMLAEELYYRAGGLVHVHPILFDGLMLHSSAELSTMLERLPGLASALLTEHPIAEGDVLIVASNSGGNATTTEMAIQARASGATVIAVTSMRHATSAAARVTGKPRLHELADVVIDNGGEVGDAAVQIAGFDKRVAPTSTVVGAAILNAVVAEAIELLVKEGRAPEVYTSINTAAGETESAERQGRL